MKIVFITGISKGLGAAVALTLLDRGFEVVGLGRQDNPTLNRGNYRFHRCDLEKVDEIERSIGDTFKTIAKRRFDFVCLINNAATGLPVGKIGTLAVSDIAQSVAVNLISPFALASLFCQIFKNVPAEKRIINISSGAAQTPVPGIGAYCIGKAGLEMLTRMIASENKGGNVVSISVHPGILDTEMQTFMRQQTHEQLPSVEVFKRYEADSLLRSPEIIAPKIVDRFVLGKVDNGAIYTC